MYAYYKLSKTQSTRPLFGDFLRYFVNNCMLFSESTVQENNATNTTKCCRVEAISALLISRRGLYSIIKMLENRQLELTVRKLCSLLHRIYHIYYILQNIITTKNVDIQNLLPRYIHTCIFSMKF